MADDTSSVDLTASTGVNDSSSPWNNLLQTALQTGVSVGQDALTNALKLQTPVTAPSSGAPGQSGAPVPAAKAMTNYLPWIIGAVVLVVVGFFLVRE